MMWIFGLCWLGYGEKRQPNNKKASFFTNLALKMAPRAGLDSRLEMWKTHANKNKISGCVNQRNELVRATFKQKKPDLSVSLALKYGSPSWARTSDKRINSPLLYQLSYRGIEAYSTDQTRMGQQ